MENPFVLLWRGLALRCPVCGKGKLFRGFFAMYEHCLVCGFVYEREEGYFTGAMAINLVVSELLVAIVTIPVAIYAGLHPSIPVWPFLLGGIPLPFLLPVLLFRPTRGLWLSIDHMIHPLGEEYDTTGERDPYSRL